MQFNIICGTMLSVAAFGSAAVLPRDASTTLAATPTAATATAATGTSNGSPAASTPTLCNNGGLQWAYWTDLTPSYNNATVQSFDPAAHKQQAPNRTGVTDYLHFRNADGSLYGQTGLNASYFAVAQRGYLLAPETGTYTFQAWRADDNVYMWIGASAFAGWTKANAQQSAYWHADTDTAGSSTFTMALTAGTYYPFRVVNRNGYGPGYLEYNITTPSGALLLGNSAATATKNVNVVQYSCDGVAAPQYPNFGSES